MHNFVVHSNESPCRNIWLPGMEQVISSLYADPDSKYLMTGCQQCFVPDPGVCVLYKPHRAFLVYLADSGSICVISESSISID